ncbi:MarR family transcriptional regulator [Caulobacter sp. Root655]|uniref:MarR family winged helix-turn-helix transcriptional regulator n=1 Tax=Caulobacter sp. Root655 TaxID=1736578 RepID=UPI0006FDF048|nr:MarR family transcriptional regulator [Caulobacter sp. Root655]KRA66015.1 MarR family transcriptional regulator [Caulobacter sp. Root655]
MSDAARTLTLDDQLCFSLYGASLAINRAYKPLLDALEITYPQYLVLSALWEIDGQSVGAIAERLGLDSSNVTPLVKRMEAAGLLSRERNPADERQVVVSLTDHGRDMQARSACLGQTLFASAEMSVEKLVQLNRDVQAFRDSVARFVVSRPQP